MVTRTEVIEFWVEPALDNIKALGLLKGFDLSSQGLKDLLACVGQVETGYRTMIQYGGGPARSFLQFEPITFEDHKQWLKAKGTQAYDRFELADLCKEPIVAFEFARFHFARRPGLIPDPAKADYALQIATLHKSVYNTAMGKADIAKNVNTISEFLKT